ncbi:MAG: response regulator [Candidatus Nitrosothermus koennekii]|nr:MAG: response regulator [Candidatus Nitrosothermus koennekii]
MRILVIDDNKDITDLLTKVLSIAGHDVKASNDGREGLELIMNDKFDIVFLDIAMPDFSGLDLIEKLIENNKINSSKIVLFTASSITDDEVNKLVERGVHSCLRKPVRMETLFAKINEIAQEAGI